VAKLGFQVDASDLSSGAVARGRHEAVTQGVAVRAWVDWHNVALGKAADRA
jgi:hypothetical protein